MAGVTTQLSWHTNLRQAHDKLATLKYYPLQEVRDISNQIESDIKAKYVHSFGHKEYPEQEQYRKMAAEEYTYYINPKQGNDLEKRLRAIFHRLSLVFLPDPSILSCIFPCVDSFLSTHTTHGYSFSFFLPSSSRQSVQGFCSSERVETR